MEPIGMLRHLDKWPELTPELAEIVAKVQEQTGYIFCPVETADILAYTHRKCEINGKGEDYVPILFENELRDLQKPHYRGKKLEMVTTPTKTDCSYVALAES